MFGMDLERYDFGNGFLAVGSGGTHLRRISVARLRELATDPVYADEIGGLVDHWVQSLSRSLTKEIIPGPVVDVLLEVGEETELANRQTARSSRGVCWIEAIEGNLIFIGMEELVFEGESSAPKGGHSMNIGLDDLFAAAADRVGHGQTLFPISFDTWIEATNPRREQTTRVLPHRSAEIASRAGMWDGLQLFHRVLCQCEFVNKRLEMVDEFNRLKTKAEYSAAARESALREIASVMQKQDEATAAAAAAGDLDPVYTACKLVGEVFGMEIVPHPEADRKAPFDDRVAQIAKASRFRTRQVVLRGSWWTGDHGPILARIEDGDQPIALIPKSTRSYQAINPTDGTAQPVTQAFADTLAPFGTVFYPPLPDSGITGMTMIKLGARGVSKDVLTLAAMGIGLGLLGTLTPFFTGKLFDTAIPEAEKGLVFQFTVALFIAAMVSSAFKITQSIATLRIQGKMDYKLQAAVWDRLLDLPSTFFRDYSSGDLADRAQGINTIRHYVAGAGVSSILGSLSSLFYVGLMFTYDMMMALLAMFLTFVFISFTFVCNYLQLRYQREKLALQGKITGMVLQLIAGVGKLRVSGAENHAFRIWAREFSQQRRIEFIIGRVQNAVQVFNTGFPVMANMAIFWTVISLMQSAAERGEQGGGMTTGDFIAFTAAYGAFQGAMMQLSNASLDLLRVVPVWERLKPIITTPAEIDNSKAYPGRLKGGIEVSHVTFRYSEDSPLILNDLSLNIQPGEFVAFVGGSGCGKSTLMRLMLGFEIPEKGSIYYDGQDLANLDVREVRQQIGVVLQNSQLFPSELYKNIIGTSSLTIDDAWEAAKMASLDKDIEDMPMGMHTYVSEGGGGLSGGQRQRLIIARALDRKPRILFLDEATSALDNRSQATVTESMQKIQATRIVIAHRLSTILHADRICYLKDGKVAEQGTYDEMMEMKGLFYELASRQMA
jgi:ATP-binding cassette subfamily C protein